MKVEAKVLSENKEATEKAQQKIKALTGSKLKTKQTKVKRQSSCSTVIVSATELTVLISQNPKSRKIKVKNNYTNLVIIQNLKIGCSSKKHSHIK